MNHITTMFNLEDENLQLDSTHIEGQIKYLTLSKAPVPHYCPLCGARMHSRGIRKRTVNHPMLQDGYQVVLLLKQRRFKCTNPICAHEENEQFKFVGERKRNTNLTELLIVEDFRDLTNSAAKIARKFHVSDTYAISTFDRYVDLQRLPLPELLCIDEVYLDMSKDGKYAMMLMDFTSGNLIDVLPSRQKKTTEPYFAFIPKAERLKVKYLITDMYNPYLNFTETYFPNAVPVVDSFHVIQWLCNSLESFLRALLKDSREKDEKHRLELETQRHTPVRYYRSQETYLLQKHKWVLLANQEHIHYQARSHYDRSMHRTMDAYSYEEAFFRIHPDLRSLRDLKEEYILFNQKHAGNPEDAKKQLRILISKYKRSDYAIFRDFAKLLEKYFDPIIESFHMHTCIRHGQEIVSRLSNGPMESLNRKPKDLIRTSRGFLNFSHIRNRLLFACRFQAPILAVPKSEKEVHLSTGKKRGPYKKHPKTDETKI